MSVMPVVDPPSLVPWTLRLGLWVALPASFVVGLGAALLLRLVLLRDVPAEPWTERARASFPARTAIAVASLVCLACFGVSGFLFPARVPNAPSPFFFALGYALTGYVAIDVVRLDVERRVHRRAIPASGWLRWKPIVFILYASQIVPAVVGAALVDDRFDARTWGVFAVVLLVGLVVGTGAIWLVLWQVGVIRPASMRLRAAVERASTRTGVVPRAVGSFSTHGVPFANAFAMPILRRIAFTSEALAVLSDDEIEAVAAHELGHVGEPRSVAFARMLRALVLVPLVLVRPAVGAAGWWGVLALFAVFFVTVRLSARLARKMEERADAIAHRGGEDGPVYARALEKLYQRNLVPAFLGGRRRTHPDLWDRMVAARATPAYAKPSPPATRRALLFALFVAWLASASIAVLHVWAQDRTQERLATYWGAEARARLDRGESANALILYVSAVGLDRRASLRAGLAWAEAVNDVCDEAARDLRYAHDRKVFDPALADVLPHADAAVEECFRRRGPVDSEFEQDADD